MVRTLQKLLVSFIILPCASLHAMNILAPYAVLAHEPLRSDRQFTLLSSIYASTFERYYDADSAQTNILRLWDCDQNVLSMLDGFPPLSPITQLRAAVDATDNGSRGHVIPCGSFSLQAAGFLSLYMRYACDWMFSMHLPFYAMRLKNVTYADQTQGIDPASMRVRSLITNNLAQNIFNLSDGLSIDPWRRAGIGDIAFLAEWSRNFRQSKPILHNVYIWFRAGLTLPTGRRADEDKLMALPFGADGAVSIPFGAGLELTLARYLHVGGDVLLTHYFGNKRCRRVKTDPLQTELFLLAKVPAFKDFGLTQEFSLFARCVDALTPGLSFTIGYHYRKHGEDIISLFSNTINAEIATNAENLREWTTHQIILRLGYNAHEHLDRLSPVIPHGSIFMQLPFKGQRSVALGVLGITLGIDF